MRALVAVSLGVLLLVGGVGLASAHINDVEADAQISANGSVVVESTLVLSEGYAVVHRVDENGDPGEVIGHRPLAANTVYQEFRVFVDDGVWADWEGNQTVWVTLHREGGGDGFDPEQDPVQTTPAGTVAGERITLARGPRAASVIVEEFDIQQISDTVRLRRIAMPVDGRVVVQRDRTAGLSAPIGSRDLSAGVHRNVTVDLDDSVFGSENRTATLFASLYPDNSSEQIRAGAATVGSYFPVQRADERSNTTTTRPLVVTPTPSPTPDSFTRTDTTRSRTVTPAADGPGFGPLLALVAVTIAILGRRR